MLYFVLTSRVCSWKKEKKKEKKCVSVALLFCFVLKKFLCCFTRFMFTTERRGAIIEMGEGSS